MNANENRTLRRSVSLLGLVMLFVGVLMQSGTTQAKLKPFFLLEGQGFSAFEPRILFVIDTSGSMVYKTNGWSCAWNDCDDADTGSNASRIAIARDAINEVVEQTGSQASFALMTFGQLQPPANSGQVPGRYSSSGGGYWDGGYWQCTSSSQLLCTSYSCGFSGTSCCGWYCPNHPPATWVPPYWVPPWSVNQRWEWTSTSNSSFDVVAPINAWGVGGLWMPYYNDMRPFAYFRHDDMGYGLTDPGSNLSQSGVPLLDPPYYHSAGASSSDFSNSDNAEREAQFFPRFLGRRFYADCGGLEMCVDNECFNNPRLLDQIIHESFGDYGNNNGDRLANVCGHDFYYWPYVDGFPGYDYFWYNQVGPTGWEYMGINHDTSGSYASANLVAPFYSESAIAYHTSAPEKTGPVNQADANRLVWGLSSPMTMGGVDAGGGTPWKSVISNPNLYATNTGGTITSTSAQKNKGNAAYSHDSVSSYLAYTVTIGTQEVCRPTIAVLITDGDPTPSSGGNYASDRTGAEGGYYLYRNLSRLRTTLGVKTYMVGFGISSSSINAMACAAAGSTNYSNPCAGSSATGFDTCRDPGNAGDCPFLASSQQELVDALTLIVAGEISTAVPAGLPSIINEFPSGTTVAQTIVNSWTETPEYEGHVTREACDDPTDTACTAAAGIPDQTPELERFDGIGTLAGGVTGCSWSRTWDAADCLSNTDWRKRRIYSYDTDLDLYRVSDDTGAYTTEFYAELNSQGLLGSGSTASRQAQATSITEFLLGKDAPNGMLLPGVAYAAPVVARRIPEPDPTVRPSVGIRDPHCAGRLLSPNQEVPSELVNFAEEAWETTPATGGFATHYEYQEAVLVGDDYGVLHAFQLHTGNELFGLLPREMQPHLRTLAGRGIDPQYGQPSDVAIHEYGIASTVNHAIVHDDVDDEWRHLAVFGFGAGGAEYVALDISHMGRLASDDPVDVLWTTEFARGGGTHADKSTYDARLGEGWSRPSISYTVENDDFQGHNPKAYMVFGSGYESGSFSNNDEGRTYFHVDAMTGEILDYAEVPYGTLTDANVYGGLESLATVAEVAVGTYCLSGYWGEMQEAYMADPAGRLYRWDLGAETDGTTFNHDEDSNSVWSGTASPVATFKACRGTGTTCTVSSSNRGEVFTYPPAVIGPDRIQETNEAGDAPQGQDEFLVALMSGSTQDDAIDGEDPMNDFHSSIYMLVDDHATGPTTGGFSIAGAASGGSITTTSSYARLPISTITRDRYIVYPNTAYSPITETRTFTKAARPLGPPQISVKAVTNAAGDVQLAEVTYIKFTVYEPGVNNCDTKWYDNVNDTWVYDLGSTYELTFRLITEEGSGFDFLANSGTYTDDFGDGFGGGSGALAGPLVDQIDGGDCAGGDCGLMVGDNRISPCQPNPPTGTDGSANAISASWGEISGFSPYER